MTSIYNVPINSWGSVFAAATFGLLTMLVVKMSRISRYLLQPHWNRLCHAVQSYAHLLWRSQQWIQWSLLWRICTEDRSLCHIWWYTTYVLLRVNPLKWMNMTKGSSRAWAQEVFSLPRGFLGTGLSSFSLVLMLLPRKTCCIPVLNWSNCQSAEKPVDIWSSLVVSSKFPRGKAVGQVELWMHLKLVH